MTIEPADRKDALAETLFTRKIRMKLALSLLLMTTTLGTGSAVLAAGQDRPQLPKTGIISQAVPGATLTQIDDDWHKGGDGWFWLSSDDDDEDEDDDDCEDDDDKGAENGCAAGATGNAAKARKVAPPQNGLFTNGTAPVVKSN